MFELLPTLFLSLGMFLLGWFAHAWTSKPEVVESEPVVTAWRCPQCDRRKPLPAGLDHKIKLCNNCNVRLVRD